MHNDTPAHFEIEVKFFLDDPQEMRSLLVSRGAELVSEAFETNLCFDETSDRLRNAGQLLRLRKDDDGCRLTFKAKSVRQSTEFKIYKELEVGVADFDTMRALLQEIGFAVSQIYEKLRASFRWQDVLCCLDTMPYGSFLELEGSEQAIRDAARQLGLNWQTRILGNYLGIFEVLREYFQLPFHNVTFADFQRHPVDITTVLDFLRIAPTT